MDISKVIKLEPGHYVVAVSGGVDSMALLDLLSKHSSKLHKFTVAHFDHGIRADSHEDRHLVQSASANYGLPFVYERAELGLLASEAAARAARYEFLRKVQAKADARAIITAHHHDDVVETAVLNLIRGTGRRGMSSLKSVDGIIRPFINVPKRHLKSYAENNGLVWHEDSTNDNLNYKRNYVRKSLLAKARAKSLKDYNRLLQILRRQRELNQAIDQRLELILHTQPSRNKLRRKDVISLPYAVAAELIAEWLRANGKRQLSKWLVNRLTVAARTFQPGTDMLLDGASKVSFTKHHIEFKNL
jgi:tRNA(Ile)-lysidine synthetase-like protein